LGRKKEKGGIQKATWRQHGAFHLEANDKARRGEGTWAHQRGEMGSLTEKRGFKEV